MNKVLLNNIESKSNKNSNNMKFAVFDEIKYLQTDKVILMQDLTQLLNILTKPAKKNY